MSYQNLILCGGGSKVFSTVGCLRVLQKKKLLSSIKEFIGCSGGNIANLILILGDVSKASAQSAEESEGWK